MSPPDDVPVLDDPLWPSPLQALLGPVPGSDPCGASIRAEALFTDIRLAREEDDPSLPMRQWERPLKKADWPRIEALCTEALIGRSKDLQLAAWLTEAWMRQGAGLAGLAQGLLLLRELADHYWDGLYPRIDPPEESGGCEARVAPFDWLGETLAHTLRVHVCLFPLAQRRPERVTLADWERLIAGELSGAAHEDGQAGGHDEEEDGEPPLTREEIIANVARHAPGLVDARLVDVREARAHLLGLASALDDHLGPEAPNLNKLAGVIDAWERVLVQVRAALPAGVGAGSAPGALASGAGPGAPESVLIAGLEDKEGGHAQAQSPSSAATHLPVALGDWHNRDEAYRTLEALAQYLASIEPHSPTPYLIRRAVNWGRLPLPELMAEIMREEGDLNRMVQLLGLSR